MAPDAGISSLDLFIVNFEPFCGDIKPVKGRGSLRAARLQGERKIILE
jgi:hypothetical protein